MEKSNNSNYDNTHKIYKSNFINLHFYSQYMPKEFTDRFFQNYYFF